MAIGDYFLRFMTSLALDQRIEDIQSKDLLVNEFHNPTEIAIISSLSPLKFETVE